MKKYTFTFLVVAFLAAGCTKTLPVIAPKPVVKEALDYKNITYNIEGKDVTLVDGKAESQIKEGYAAKVTTRIFEASTQGDLNGDGLDDAAVVLTQDSGGSGIFYYIAVAIKNTQGYAGSNAILLGDRIAPQNNQIKNNILTVNYADRKPGEDFSTKPSVGKSLYLEYFNNRLIAQPEALQVLSPKPYEAVNSSLTISGQARGTWFFEASFPVVLKNAKGEIIAQGIAKTIVNWMTENFVPFTAVLNFSAQESQSAGVLVLKKDNPSGLPENDMSYEIPVVFK
jgi:hypothetical protein